jgi:hypothetical protein
LLAPIIKASAITWAIAKQSAAEIDASNILKASIKCMHLALDQLKPKAKFIAVDGNRFYVYKKIPHQTIIKGDGIYANIAAASILGEGAARHPNYEVDSCSGGRCILNRTIRPRTYVWTNVSHGNASKADLSLPPRFAYRTGAWPCEMLRF